MVTAEKAMPPGVEKRTRLLAAVLFVLGGLAILAPLLAGANAESRVGLLLILAALIELFHGFRRSSEEGRKAAWQSGAVTILMGFLVVNSDSLIFSAFLLFLGGWFAFDAVRYVVRGFREERSSRGALVTWVLPALGNAAVALFILIQYQKAPSWIVSVVGCLADLRDGLERARGGGLHRGGLQPDDGPGSRARRRPALGRARRANPGGRKRAGATGPRLDRRVRRDALRDPPRPHGARSHGPRHPLARRRRLGRSLDRAGRRVRCHHSGPPALEKVDARARARRLALVGDRAGGPYRAVGPRRLAALAVESPPLFDPAPACQLLPAARPSAGGSRSVFPSLRSWQPCTPCWG